MLQVRVGQVIGRDHLARRANCQDAMALGGCGETVVGIVCDGCGSGAYSEVGARMAAQYLVAEAERLLRAGYGPGAIPRRLYTALVNYLEAHTVISHPQDRASYVLNNLLFTVVGTVLTPDGGVVFTAGDGLVVIDENVLQIDQGNAPAYPAYHLVRDVLPDDYKVPVTFDVHEVDADWTRVGVASDGYEADLLSDAWGHRHQRGLQRRMNVLSDNEHRFRDDATLITVEKLDEEITE